MHPSTRILWLFVLALSLSIVSACNQAIQQPEQNPTVTPQTEQADETSPAILLPSATPQAEPTQEAAPTAQDEPAPQATPLPQTTPQPAGQGMAPAPAPVGTVVYYESTIEIPTYPYEEYTSKEVDPNFNWPFRRFNLEAFEQAQPTPVNKSYRLIVLENAYLKILVAPELGGRILQVFHKPSGDSMLYRNFVVKPTRWGPGNQLGWMAAGGIEWNLPVVEHGYDWGTAWGIIPLQHSEDLATVTVFTPQDGRLLNASITIGLRSGAAAFEIQPTLSNLSTGEITFDYWHSAALAPGPGNQLSDQLRFIFPTEQMTVHSTQDPVYPPPGQQVSWPLLADGRDISRIGTWQQFAGLFEYPAAHGPFVGVYDPTFDDGAVRVFPADIAQGSKLFSLGWGDPLASTNYTDDGSQYVELHGGLAATFDQHATLPAGGMVSWTESWYPVHGIGGISTANEVGSLFAERRSEGLFVGFYPTRPFDGMLNIMSDGVQRLQTTIESRPDQPYAAISLTGELSPGTQTIQIEDNAGNVLIAYELP